MRVLDRVREHGSELTPAERRVANVVVANPQIIGFGTVADLAEAAGTGAATVVRLANKLGYDGYADLQDAVQRDLSGQLRPAAERIRGQQSLDGADGVQRHADTAQANVANTLAQVDVQALDDVVGHLVDEGREVLVLSGTASRGVAMQFVNDLGQLRGRVSLLDGNQVDIQRTLALTGESCTLLAVDVHRYDRWVVDTLRRVRSGSGIDGGLPAWVVALTDSVLSPLAALADRTFVISAESSGPFDSHVGTLALLDMFVVGVAAADRDRATRRLDRLENAWSSGDALTDQ
jgi:DNA-binding MurR/RpiR family transcriptional regulator